MFDSPVADRRPGQLARIGSPWHGLLEFPLLQNAISCPPSSVKLTTHGGKVLYPFSEYRFSAGRSPVLSASRLFMDPRAVDVPEQDNGEDWSGYVVLHDQGWLAGEPRIVQGMLGVYHAAGSNHRWRFEAPHGLRVYGQIRIGRGDSESSDSFRDYIDIPYPTRWDYWAVCDSTPEGGSSLLYVYSRTAPSGLVRLNLTGEWPEISADSETIFTLDETYTSQITLSGTSEAAAPWRDFGGRASCWRAPNGRGECGFTLSDSPSTGTGTFKDTHAGSRQDRERWLVTAHFEGEQVKTTWFEQVERLEWDHVAQWSSETSETPGPGPWESIGARLDMEYSLRTERTLTIDWSFKTDDGADLAGAKLVRQSVHQKDWSQTWRAGGLNGVPREGSETDNDESEGMTYSSSLTFEGIDVMSLFPEFNSSIVGTGSSSRRYPNYWVLEDTTTPVGTSERLVFICTPFLYSRDLACMRMHCIYEKSVSGAVVESREIQLFGTAVFKEKIDPGVTTINSNATVYGAGCPKTKKIARNYPYPVAWI